MEDLKGILKQFIDWASDCGEDTFYIFDNTEDAIEEFINHLNI